MFIYGMQKYPLNSFKRGHSKQYNTIAFIILYYIYLSTCAACYSDIQGAFYVSYPKVKKIQLRVSRKCIQHAEKGISD